MVQTASEAGFGNIQRRALPAPATPRQNLNVPVEAFGGGMANNYTPLARATGMGAEAAFKVQQEEDALGAAALDEQFQREVLQRAYTGPDAWFAKTGGDAMGLADEADKQLADIRKKYASTTTNPRVAELFNRSAERTQTSMLGSVGRHQLTQLTSYRSEVGQGRIKLNAEQVALNPLDDKLFEQTLKDNTSAALALHQGEGDAGAKIYEENSKLFAARAYTLMQSDNPEDVVRGGEFFDRSRKEGKLTLEHVSKLESLRDAAYPKALATRAYQQTTRDRYNFGEVTSDKIFGAVLLQESGGQQLKNGVPVTSPKGAIGIAQVMPDTAKEMAPEIFGAPLDEEKYRYDPEYNAALGKGYFNKMQTKYGNTALALMAYNAGPGAVDERITKFGNPANGEVSFDRFLSTMPAETQKYVTNIRGSLGFAGAGKIDAIQASAKAEELEKVAAGAGDNYLSIVKKQNDMVDQQQKDYALGIKQQVADVMAQSNGDISAVPSHLKGEAMRLGLWQELSNFDGATETNAILKLRGMTQDEFAKTDLREYAGRLSREDLLKEVERQTKLKEGDEGYKKFADSTEKYWIRSTGKNDTGTPKSSFQIRADEQFRAFVRKENRPPNDEESRVMLQGLTLESDDWGTKKGYEFQPVEDYSIGGVPRAEYKNYANALTSLGYDVTQENIEALNTSPQKIVGAVDGVPNEQIKPAVDRLVKSGHRISPQNIRVIYELAKLEMQRRQENGR
jgi:hypothetical protein